MAQVQQGTYITTPALSVIVSHLEIVAVPTPAGAKLLMVTVPVPLAVQELAEDNFRVWLLRTRSASVSVVLPLGAVSMITKDSRLMSDHVLPA